MGLGTRLRAATIQGSEERIEVSPSNEMNTFKNPRRAPASGFNLRSGSQTRHLAMKSTKSSSSDLST